MRKYSLIRRNTPYFIVASKSALSVLGLSCFVGITTCVWNMFLPNHVSEQVNLGLNFAMNFVFILLLWKLVDQEAPR